MVLLHGFTGSSHSWREHAEIFSKHFTVLALDLPGHGKTNTARYRIEQCAEDLIAIFDHFQFDHVHLLGYSMGGRIALYLAVHYPHRVRKLILESTSPGLETETERQARIQSDESLAERIEREGVEAFVDYWEQIPLFASQANLPPEIRTRLRAQRLDNNPTGLATSLREMGTGVQPSLWGELDRVSMPVLLLAGEQDTKFTAIAHRMYSLLSQAQIEIIKHAGHTPHLEQPDVFQKHVIEFLGY